MRTVVLGLGQYPKGSGIMSALFVAQRGDEVIVVEPYYTVAMEANKKRLEKYPNIRVITKNITEKILKGADLVIRHQRLRRDEPLLVASRRLGIPIETELSLFLKGCPAEVIGITGTRGKSTTTALIYAMCAASKKWRKAWLAGNILSSPLLDLPKMGVNDIVILEMSSFQLEGTGDAAISPPVAVWTNLMRDHLNAYPDMKAYADAKAEILRHQQPSDVVFLPQDRFFDTYAKQAPSAVYRVGRKQSVEQAIVADLTLRLPGEHNRRNAEMSAAVAIYLGVTPGTIKRVLQTFAGLPDRQEEVAVIRGVHYINDTTATTPDATIAALETFVTRGRVHLIFGGANKELVFDDVAKKIKRSCASVCVLPGTAHELIVDAFVKAKVMYQDVTDMKEAVQILSVRAKKGEVVLLSPGCASFGQFHNEYHRGEIFRRLVKGWQRKQAAKPRAR